MPSLLARACCASLLAACAAAPDPSPGPSPGQDPAAPAAPGAPSRWTIGPALVECVGVAPMWCLQQRDASGGPWTVHFGGIEGFEFRPGDEVDILVRFEAVARPLADAPSRRAVLERVLERRVLAGLPLPAALAGTAWTLEAMPGAAVALAGLGGAPTLRFEEGGRMSGGSGVNRYGAEAWAGEGWLRVGPPALTRMAGPPEAMALEAEYLGRLQRAGHWRVEGDGLRLLDAAGAALLSFRRAAAAP